MRGPRLAGFGLDVGEPGARGRVGNADQNLAGRALNLPAGELRFTLQGLVAVGTIEFEFVGVHKWIAFHFIMRKPGAKSIGEIYLYF
jgi:hypothetical protein